MLMCDCCVCMKDRYECVCDKCMCVTSVLCNTCVCVCDRCECLKGCV